ncbi:MAG: HEAT repeat domain-containing protein, partial [Deltaproteobacteria bacterium]|nr:HEAT repeat domain-containing protein [Deltaproteobacteria bacterium]
RTALDLEERIAAVRALAATGAIDTSPACLAIVQAGPTQPAALTRVAAAAVVALDSPRTLEPLTQGWLASKDPRAIDAALAVLAETPMATSVRAVRGLTEDRASGVRAAACTALAPSAGLGAGAWSAINSAAEDRDATVRAACLAAIARANGDPPRSTYGRALAALEDRDERVRAAAALAIARVAPAKAARDLRPHLRDRSPLVRAAVARAWANLDGAMAALAPAITDDDPTVRAAAIQTLAARPDGAAAIATAAGDRDPRVRAEAAAALTDDAALARLVGDDDPMVRTAAVVRTAARAGRERAQADLAAALATAPAASLERVRLARAWLLAP